MSDPDQISKNFTRSEFSCKCGCGFDTVDIGLLAILETIRAQFGRAVSIRSGCRCLTHNAEVDGRLLSQHVRARAADFIVSGVPADQVQDFIDQAWPNSLGMGRYALWTHVDSRNTKARW